MTIEDLKEKLNISIEEHIKLNVQNMDKKPITYVFAKNGVGKTTYTRKINEIKKENNLENILIYNQDFIVNNIFISSIDKENSEIINNISNPIKNSTFKLFYAENIKDISDKIDKNQKCLDEIKNKINDFIKKGYIETIKQNQKYFDFKEPTFNELKKSFKDDQIKDFIVSSKEIEKKIISSIEKIKNNEIINDFFAECEKVYFLINNTNKIIDFINENFNKQKNEETIIINLHKEAMKIKKDFLFIRKIEIKQKDIEEYLKEYSNKVNEKITSLNLNVKKIKKKIKEIFNRGIYKEIKKIKEVNELFEKFSDVVKKINENNDNFKKININIYSILENLPFLNIEEKRIDFEKEKKIIKNEFEKNKINFFKESYEINRNFKEDKKIECEINKLKIQREDNLVEISEKIEKRFNYFLNHFDASFKILLPKPKQGKGSSGNYEIEINKEIKKLSEGERKIFSLSYFFVHLEIKINKLEENENLIVLIDDPFDSNDHSKANKLSNIKFNLDKFGIATGIGGLGKKINENKKEKQLKSKFIIFTHNLNVLYELTSSLKNNENDKKKLFSDMKNDDKNDVEIREWKLNSGNTRVDEIINFRSFFPNEENISNFLESIFINFIIDSNFKIEDEYIKSLKTIFYIIVRINDIPHNEKKQCIRNNYKNLIQNEIWGGNYPKNKEENICKNIHKILNSKILSKDNERIKEISNKIFNSENDFLPIKKSMINFEKLFEIDCGEKDILINFSKRFSLLIQNAHEKKDENLLRRIRHRNYLSSTIVAFGIEE
ncbi:MAG: hypothetical protein TYPL_4030 [Candidatus Tyloplasma litorale]|nr:MAG: hypothetical protein TYPL_4030 [Mycoplasmatales bacterium]